MIFKELQKQSDTDPPRAFGLHYLTRQGISQCSFKDQHSWSVMGTWTHRDARVGFVRQGEFSCRGRCLSGAVLQMSHVTEAIRREDGAGLTTVVRA